MCLVCVPRFEAHGDIQGKHPFSQWSNRRFVDVPFSVNLGSLKFLLLNGQTVFVGHFGEKCKETTANL